MLYESHVEIFLILLVVRIVMFSVVTSVKEENADKHKCIKFIPVERTCSD